MKIIKLLLIILSISIQFVWDTAAQECCDHEAYALIEGERTGDDEWLGTLTVTSPAITPNVFDAGVLLTLGTIAPISGSVVLVNDGTANPTEACSPLTPANAAAVNGNIALIDRGSCFFNTKISNAIAAGATAIIICNNDVANPNDILDITGVSTVPILLISFNACQTIKANLPNVQVTMETVSGIDLVGIDGSTGTQSTIAENINSALGLAQLGPGEISDCNYTVADDNGMLYSVDLVTGDLSLIASSCVSNPEIFSIQTNITTGIVYVVDIVGALYTLDLATGTCTATGISLPIQELIIDNLGNAYVLDVFGDQICQVDLTTGIFSSCNSLSVALDDIREIHFDFVAGGNEIMGYVLIGGDVNYVSIDSATGAVTIIQNLGNDTEVVAFSSCAIEPLLEPMPVPTLGQWGIIILSLFFLAIGVGLVSTRSRVLV